MFGFRAAILFSYLLYGMIESRAFSFGNTYSVLLLLVAFDTARYRAGSDNAKARPPLADTQTSDPRRLQPIGTLSR